jgi:hypothetical protein
MLMEISTQSHYILLATPTKPVDTGQVNVYEYFKFLKNMLKRCRGYKRH